MQPAIKVAEDGFVLSTEAASIINSACAGRFQQSPASMAIYCPDPPFAPGDLFKQPDLAKSLRILAKYGPNAIYNGELGKKMVEYLQSIGNLITMKDLENWQENLVQISKPGHVNYRGYDVYTSAFNSGGENLIEILNILKNFDLGAERSANSVHLMMEAYKAAFTDRFYYVADPWTENVPYFGLMCEEYGLERSGVINTTAANPSYPVGDPWPYDTNPSPGYYLQTKYPFVREDNSRQTSSLSVIDKDGNMVANTYTMRDWFGSGITIPGTGITMNNGSGLFSFNPASMNRIEGGKSAVNNMNAFLIMNDGEPFVSGGASGGRTIMTSCTETIVNMIDHGMDIDEAMNTPRFHCEQLESTCYFESSFASGILSTLATMGHKTTDLRPSIGVQHGVMIDPATGNWIAGRDSRKDTSTAGGFQK